MEMYLIRVSARWATVTTYRRLGVIYKQEEFISLSSLWLEVQGKSANMVCF